MSLSERLVQLTIRAKDYLTRDVKPATDAMKELAQEGARLKASLADASAARSLARTLRDNKQATEGLQQAFNDAKATLEDLTREVGENEQATAGQRIAIREARRTLEQTEQAYKRNQSAIKNTTSELKRLGVDTADIGNEEKRLTAEITQNKQALQENRSALKTKAQEEAKAAKAAADHAASTGRVTSAIESAGKRILAFGAAYLSLNAAVSLVRGSINLFREGLQAVLNVGEHFEKLERRMTSIMGSLAEGEKATAWVREFADSTGQRVTAVADAFAMLKSYGLDPMDGSMQALTDKAEQLGGGLESLQGITAAVGQMWAKEKIQQEEVLQLVERGINVWPMLSKALGKTTPELQDLAAKGKLGRDAVKLLIDEIGKSAQGSAAASLDSLTGKWNVLLNSIEGFAAKVASSGAMDAVKQRLQGLINTLDAMANDGSLDRFAQSLSAAFVDGVEWVENFAKKLGTVDFKKFANDASTALSDFRSKLDAVTRSAELISSPFRAIADVWVITTGTCIKQMLRLVAVTGEAGAFIAKILPDAFGGRAVEEALKKQAGHVRSWMDKLGTEIDSSANDIKANWRSVAGSASESAEQSANAFIQAGQKVRDELAAQAQDMEHHIRNNLTGLDNALSAIFLSETAEHLNEVERAITKAGLAGVMTAKEMAEAQEALNAKRGFLGLSVDVKEATQSLESLRAEQALLSKQYFEGALSLEAWQQGHNELTKKIRELEQGTQSATVAIKDLQSAQDAISAAKTIGELEAVKKALFTAYQNKDLNLEQFQQLHNQAAKAIRDLGGAADGSAVALAGLDNALGSLEKSNRP